MPNVTTSEPALTVRDKVMLHILQGMLAKFGLEGNNPDAIVGAVEESYKMADKAMRVIANPPAVAAY